MNKYFTAPRSGLEPQISREIAVAQYFALSPCIRLIVSTKTVRACAAEMDLAGLWLKEYFDNTIVSYFL